MSAAARPGPLALAVALLSGASGACGVADAGATDLGSPVGDAGDVVDAGLLDLSAAVDLAGPCPGEMVLVGRDAGAVCVDRYEARVVELTDGGERDWPPTHAVDGHRVKAVVVPGTQPQAYISGAQAEAACGEAHKRLCTPAEWSAACRGPQNLVWPYGNTRVPGACNEGRAVHPVIQYFGTSDPSIWDDVHLNNPGIDEQADTVAPGGAHALCVSAWGAWDLAGNLHEWVADPAGTFQGGYYVDDLLNGPGCTYRTTAHAFSYHDYSTGFRCCRDAR